jgi:hypothetical protein
MKTIKTIWHILNGNKTIIAQFLLLLMAKKVISLKEPWMEITEWVLWAMAGGAIVHHAQKGYFSPDKGH